MGSTSVLEELHTYPSPPLIKKKSTHNKLELMLG